MTKIVTAEELVAKAGVWTRRGTRADGWISPTTGAGTSQDKSTTGSFYDEVLTDQEARAIWIGNAEGAKIVEKLPETMLRAGFEIQIKSDDDEDDTARTLKAAWEDLGFATKLQEALCIERALRGAIILIGVDDGQAPTEPLDLARVRKPVSFLSVFERSECTPRFWYTDPNKPKFREVSHWQIDPNMPGSAFGAAQSTQTALVHESRLLVFPGLRVGYASRYLSEGFGASVLGRVKQALRGFGSGMQSTEVLLHDFSQAVWKIKDLAKKIAQNRGGEIVEQMKLAEISRSTVRAVWIDGEDEFARIQTPMSGLPEVMEILMRRLAAVGDMPVMVMFGDTPSGLNSTGKGEERTWYDEVAAKREAKLTPIIERFARILMAGLKIVEPESWCIKYGSLYQESDRSRAEIDKLHADTDSLRISDGILYPEEALRARARGEDPLVYADKQEGREPPVASEPAPMPIAGEPPAEDAEENVPTEESE